MIDNVRFARDELATIPLAGLAFLRATDTGLGLEFFRTPLVGVHRLGSTPRLEPGEGRPVVARAPGLRTLTRKAGKNDHDRTAFIEASTWADLIRYDPRFHDAGDPATPLLPGFPDMDNHRDWHYVNRPLDGYPAARSGEGERTGQLDTQLEVLAATLGSRESSERTTMRRSYALPLADPSRCRRAPALSCHRRRRRLGRASRRSEAARPLRAAQTDNEPARLLGRSARSFRTFRKQA